MICRRLLKIGIAFYLIINCFETPVCAQTYEKNVVSDLTGATPGLAVLN